jgi:hypothetical protein
MFDLWRSAWEPIRSEMGQRLFVAAVGLLLIGLGSELFQSSGASLGLAHALAGFLFVTGAQFLLWGAGARTPLLGTATVAAEQPEAPEEKSKSIAPVDERDPGRALDLFKFYETAADKAKQHAWSATTWILAFNAAILAFSFDFFGKHAGKPGFVVIEIASAFVGVGLCAYLTYLLKETGTHIAHYWTSANRLAADQASLVPFIGADEAEKVRTESVRYRASFPNFCRRLQMLACLFALVHLGSAYLLIHHGAKAPADPPKVSAPRSS